jgi:hypothetical protein
VAIAATYEVGDLIAHTPTDLRLALDVAEAAKALKGQARHRIRNGRLLRQCYGKQDAEIMARLFVALDALEASP